MDTKHLLARAADTDQTAPERAACLSAAARIALPDPAWPSPPPGWTWRDGRVVSVTSNIPPLDVRPYPVVDEEAPVEQQSVEVEESDQPTQAEELNGSEAPKPKTVRPPKPSSSAARVIGMLRRPMGVSVDEAMAELGCARISVKALISINSRRVGSRAVLDGGRYRMVGGELSLTGAEA